MKAAIALLLLSSVTAQRPKPGDKVWEKTMKEQRMMLDRMEKKGHSLKVDLKPRTCKSSHDCPGQYRMGGCCGTTYVVSGKENLSP